MQLCVVALALSASVLCVSAQPGGFGQGGPFTGQGLGGQGVPFGGQGGQGGGFGGPFGAGGFPGGFPPGFPSGFPGFPGQGFSSNFGQNFRQQILTCIGTNEATDQFKVTLRPEPGSAPFQSQVRPELQRQNWRVSILYLPAASLGNISPAGTTSLVGRFFVAINKYGRVADSCAHMGGVLQNEDTLFGSSDPTANNPYLQALRNPQNPFGTPAGYIEDPIVIGQGGNVYSSFARDLCEADISGRSLGICLDHNCQRPTTMCCTFAKDSAPATDQLGPINQGPISGSALAGGGSSASASSSSFTGAASRGGLF